MLMTNDEVRRQKTRKDKLTFLYAAHFLRIACGSTSVCRKNISCSALNVVILIRVETLLSAPSVSKREKISHDLCAFAKAGTHFIICMGKWQGWQTFCGARSRAFSLSQTEEKFSSEIFIRSWNVDSQKCCSSVWVAKIMFKSVNLATEFEKSLARSCLLAFVKTAAFSMKCN